MISSTSWLLTLTLLAGAGDPGAGLDVSRRAADGVPVDPDGNPIHATFSLCALDPETREIGVAVTTRVPFVGRAVPWVRAGVGAVATQAWTVVEYGPRGLDLLAEGLEPKAVIEKLLVDDAGREQRQLGVLDVQGRAAAHTGAENGVFAGSRQGPNYTVQGNILVGRQVIDAVAESFESSAGIGMPLAERMIRALAAGHAQGGDKRWGYLQSAAIRIADPKDPGRGGDHISLAIDVGENADPVAEMMRIYQKTARRLGWRELSIQAGADVRELKSKLHLLGYFRPDLDALPEPPDFDVDPDLRKTDPAAFLAAVDAYREKAQAFERTHATFDDETAAAVDAFRKEHGLDYEGNPRGLVDARFVAALDEAVAAKRRSGS